jgi:hypothetical protein
MHGVAARTKEEDLAAPTPAPTPARQLVNAPLLIVVGSVSLVALIYLLTYFPMFVAAAMVHSDFSTAQIVPPRNR